MPLSTPLRIEFDGDRSASPASPPRPKRRAVFARSASVGIVATVADLACLALFISVLGISPSLASPIGLLVGASVQFVGQRAITFRAHGTDWKPQVLPFALVEVLTLGLNALLFELAVTWTPWPYWALRPVLQSAVYFGFSLPLWSLVFKPSAAPVSP